MPAARHVPAGLLVAVLVAGCTSDPPAEPPTSPAPSASATSTSSPSASVTPSPSEVATVPLPTATSGGGAGDSDRATTTPAPAPTSTASASPSANASSSAPTRSLAIEAPADGDEVSSPVSLEVTIEGFELVELGTSVEPTEGHLWAFVDLEPPQERVRLPESTSIVKSAEPTIELGSLEPGEHTVTVLATHGYPVPFEPRISDTVTFTVTE